MERRDGYCCKIFVVKAIMILSCILVTEGTTAMARHFCSDPSRLDVIEISDGSKVNKLPIYSPAYPDKYGALDFIAINRTCRILITGLESHLIKVEHERFISDGPCVGDDMRITTTRHEGPCRAQNVTYKASDNSYGVEVVLELAADILPPFILAITIYPLFTMDWERVNVSHFPEGYIASDTGNHKANSKHDEVNTEMAIYLDYLPLPSKLTIVIESAEIHPYIASNAVTSSTPYMLFGFTNGVKLGEVNTIVHKESPLFIIEDLVKEHDNFPIIIKTVFPARSVIGLPFLLRYQVQSCNFEMTNLLSLIQKTPDSPYYYATCLPDYYLASGVSLHKCDISRSTFTWFPSLECLPKNTKGFTDKDDRESLTTSAISDMGTHGPQINSDKYSHLEMGVILASFIACIIIIPAAALLRKTRVAQKLEPAPTNEEGLQLPDVLPPEEGYDVIDTVDPYSDYTEIDVEKMLPDYTMSASNTRSTIETHEPCMQAHLSNHRSMKCRQSLEGSMPQLPCGQQLELTSGAILDSANESKFRGDIQTNEASSNKTVSSNTYSENTIDIPAISSSVEATSITITADVHRSANFHEKDRVNSGPQVPNRRNIQVITAPHKSRDAISVTETEDDLYADSIVSYCDDRSHDYTSLRESEDQEYVIGKDNPYYEIPKSDCDTHVYASLHNAEREHCLICRATL